MTLEAAPISRWETTVTGSKHSCSLMPHWRARASKKRNIVFMSNCADIPNRQTAFASHQSWPMVKSVSLAALICAASVCASSAQDAKVSVDMMGIGAMSCAHWQSTQAHRLEGTIWIYGFWTGLNYVASASDQTETKVDTAAAVVEVRKTCAQSPSQPLASAVWTAYLDLNKK
jgi:hypothetical protein